MEKKRKFFYFIPFIVLGVAALLGVVVMLLWNTVVADLFSLKPISYPQALGLFILCKILFGSFRPGPRGPFRRQGAHWREKLMNMTPEERETMKEEWRKRRFPHNKS